ncbi:hypothetical protein A33M_1082 [Rhodovulum sp. PH10]|nr:hypothetical protein A33M_1082 [Rhodovulum sp. PH10]
MSRSGGIPFWQMTSHRLSFPLAPLFSSHHPSSNQSPLYPLYPIGFLKRTSRSLCSKFTPELI